MKKKEKKKLYGNQYLHCVSYFKYYPHIYIYIRLVLNVTVVIVVVVRSIAYVSLQKVVLF
jgi:hypothetical protein